MSWATVAQKGRWRAATRWRAWVERALSGSGLTFTQWLVLDALRELIAETEDAVNQNEVSARVELARATVSFVMRTLEQKSLVSRGPDLTGRAWRIYLTESAEQLLRDLAARIEAASWESVESEAARQGSPSVRGRGDGGGVNDGGKVNGGGKVNDGGEVGAFG